YYVDRVETIGGQTLYTHSDGGTPVLDRDAALTTIDILKKVLGPDGTAYRYPLEGGRPAAGKTGTQQDNTNATFVGFTPQLSTAVWIGDPDGYTEMTRANVPELVDFDTVQGGRYPALIWKTFMDPALAGKPSFDWPAPPPPTRYPARLFLPGQECVTRIVRYETQVIGYGTGGGDQQAIPQGFVTPGRAPAPPPPGTEPPGQTTAAPTTAPPTTAPPPPPPPPPPTVPGNSPSPSPPTTAATPVPQLPPEQTTSPTTQAPVPITQVVPIYDELTATTISPKVLDPLAPMPSVPVSQPVRTC
ncbi:MAG: hypothetical protein H0V69_14200, partial [Acidimicrobiia bacterium]|nr:hypothetical protein [Acidimicrobiia bacterium]